MVLWGAGRARAAADVGGAVDLLLFGVGGWVGYGKMEENEAV